MRFSEYVKDKILIIVLNFFCAFLLNSFLFLVNNTASTVIIIDITWFIIIAAYFFSDYYKRNKYFKHIDETLNSLDKRYLIGEVIEPSYRLEDKEYIDIIRRSNKSVIEKINQVEDEKKDYKEYIESWVHDVKIPITAMELICENNKSSASRRIQCELSKLDSLVETVLYYARAGEVYKDYLVKEESLTEIINETITRNKSFFIQNKMCIDIDCKDDKVCCDKKWIGYILNQIFINAVKYKKNDIGRINIYTEKTKEGVKCVIEDDGTGIRPSEINRIFDKGFTGTNGRDNAKSTGIGLYLCKKLCLKLGMEIYAESEFNKYTKLILVFPLNTYLSKL